jgi:hypothetical protein
MRKRYSVYLMMLAMSALLLAACGSSDEAMVPLASVKLASDKRIALANGSEDITMTATVKDIAGKALSGKSISFLITKGSGSLHGADLTTGPTGTAAVMVNRVAISPGTYEDVTIKATVTGAAGSKTVRFINLPTTMVAEVGLNKVVSNMATFTFDVVSTPTQSPIPIVEPINQAATGAFIPNVNTFASLLNFPNTYTLLTVNTPAITTVAGSPVVRLTYLINQSITELPVFALGEDPLHVTANGPLPNADPIAVAPADLFMNQKFDTEP